MQKKVCAVAVLGLTMIVAPACSTKKFVRTEVGSVNSKVDTLTTSVETTQERTRQNETRIGLVDTKAEAAGRSAVEAGRTAAEAGTAASAAANAAKAVDGRVNAVEASARRLLYEVTLSEDSGDFKLGDAALPDEAKARLDQMVTQLKSDPKGVFIEIEGHTDNVGNPDANQRLSLDRAETVRAALIAAVEAATKRSIELGKS